MKKFLKVFSIIIVVIIILILIIGIAGYFFIKNKLNKINYEAIDKQDIEINENLYNEVAENITLEEFNEIKTIVIFGSDSRNVEDLYQNGRSDSIIVASINPTNHSLKIISIPRDTYVSVPGYGQTKINHAFAYGQEQLSIKTINSNFGLNIEEYVTINWEGVKSIVDDIGGIELEISEEELGYINKNIAYTAKNSNGDPTTLESAGLVHMNGTQALTHCRNRYVGNDFVRAERQRTVIQKILEKVMEMDIATINKLVDKFLGYIKTNVNIDEYTKFIPSVLKYKTEYLNNIVSAQIPSAEYAQGQNINGVYYFVGDLDTCSQEFKKYLYE